MDSQEEKAISSLGGVNVQEVIGLLLSHHNDENSMNEVVVASPNDLVLKSDQISVAPLSISSMTLADTGLSLIDPEDLVEEGQAIQLEDGTTAFVHSLNEESNSSEALPKFFDGQAVQLEDGTTAYIHTSPKEGLHAVQLEDGTTAYISAAPPDSLFDEETPSLNLENLEATQESDQESEKEISITKASSNRNVSSRSTMLVAEKGFPCSFEGCGRFYSTLHHLKVHERSHTGDRPYHCVVFGCGKAFTTSYGLKSHMRVHTGETPYKCPDKSCLKAFKTSGDLQKHVRIHTGERPFKCPFEGCDRAFTTSNIQKVHIRTHTGERPYLCKSEGCGRAFASATNFKNHIRIHTGEKPYACSVVGCGKRFTEYSSLYKHHVVHTHNKPYTCFLCGRHYRQTSTLAMHKRTVHDIVDTGDDEILEPAVTLVENSIDLGPDQGEFPDKEALRKKTRLRQTDVNVEDIIIDEDSSHAEKSDGQQYVVVTIPADIVALEQLAKDARLGHLTTNADGSISLQVSKEDIDPMAPLTISTQDGTVIAYGK